MLCPFYNGTKLIEMCKLYWAMWMLTVWRCTRFAAMSVNDHNVSLGGGVFILFIQCGLTAICTGCICNICNSSITVEEVIASLGHQSISRFFLLPPHNVREVDDTTDIFLKHVAEVKSRFSLWLDNHFRHNGTSPQLLVQVQLHPTVGLCN